MTRPSVQNKFIYRVPLIGGWLLSCADARAMARLKKEFDPQFKKATKSGKPEELDSVERAWASAWEEVFHPMHAVASRRLATRARKCGIWVQPPSTSEWFWSDAAQDWILKDEVQHNLRREIRAEERSKYDEFRKWTSVLLAGAAFVLGLFSLLKKNQSDPCPRNYYRTDAGSCAFALPSKSQTSFSNEERRSPQQVPLVNAQQQEHNKQIQSIPARAVEKPEAKHTLDSPK